MKELFILCPLFLASKSPDRKQINTYQSLLTSTFPHVNNKRFILDTR